MALISKPQSANKAVGSNQASSASNNSMADKRKKRTLAKQQQISEQLANASSELLSKTQEGVSAIEELSQGIKTLLKRRIFLIRIFKKECVH